MKTLRTSSLLLAAMTATFVARDASAVILIDKEQRNLTPPTGSLLEAWNLQGSYGSFNVTPISPHQFITAAHAGLGAGGVMNFQGNSYSVPLSTDIAGTDLRVFTISGTFPTFAPLYDASVGGDGSEIGKPLAVFGRGTQRGAAVIAPISPGPTATSPVNGTIALTASPPMPTPVPPLPGNVRGWAWGADDRLPSWGRNVVDDVVMDDRYGQLLSFSFSAGAGKVADEGGLSTGDSGGGVFIFSGGQWKLAAVNLGLDGPFSYTAAGPYFNADIFDARGLYVGTPAENGQLPYDDAAIEGSSYSSRIGGSNLAAIRALIGATGGSGTGGPTLAPEPGMAAALGAAVIALSRRRRADTLSS